LVLSPSYPQELRDVKVYLAGGVSAAFECKVTLYSEHIGQGVQRAADLRRLIPLRRGTPYRELPSQLVFGLLAHSHDWKAEKSTPLENVSHRLYSADQQLIKHPREMLDVLCVADLATWAARKHASLNPDDTLANCHPDYAKSISPTPIISAYMCSGYDEQFTPAGALITKLLRALAWEDPGIRDLAEYFELSGLEGEAFGYKRDWDPDVLSDRVRGNKVPIELVYEKWSEWSKNFA
jgi:hypothetical protein